MHLRLLDVLSGGVAAHPQCFIVVDHDVSCPTASLQGEKAKSGVHRHSLVVLGVGQQGWAAYPLQRPDDPTASREQLSATPCPASQHPARTSDTWEHLQPQPGGPFAADAQLSRWRHPNLLRQGKGVPAAGAAPCLAYRGGLSGGAGGAAGGRSPLRCLAAGAD